MSGKILIADDEEHMRELVVISLEDFDYDIYEVPDGYQALSKARELKPDVLILDVMMPEKSGYDVCEELKKDPETSGIFILLLSSIVNPSAERTGLAKGADAFMTKPFEPSDLRELVNKAFKNH